VSRRLAGVFDPHGRIDATRLTTAIDGQARVLTAGPLQVALSGPAPARTQPLCLLDGFLDNAEELAAALEAPADAPPESLLASGWQAFGPGLPARMRGDFALLIWDAEREQGLLARDQLGVRSIFLHGSGAAVCFAGEMRDLLRLLPRTPAPDPMSVAHWLSMSSRPGSATLYEGVRRLDPGSMLLLDADGIREQAYWTPRFSEPESESHEQLAERVQAQLQRAVSRRIAASEPTGVLMSGGLDSASVAALATAQAPGRITAYSGVFPDHPRVDEAELIAELRGALQLPGLTAQVRPGGLLASAAHAARLWRLPLLSWDQFWTLPLLHAARSEGVRTLLGGDGGDELFGPRSYLLADRLLAGRPLQTLRLAMELPGAAYRPPRREVARMVLDTALLGALPHRMHELLRKPSAASGAPTWLLRKTRQDLLASADPLAWKRLDGPRWWTSIAHGLSRGIDEIGIFEQQRQTAALADMQARHPLLDFDLVELCLRLPPQASFDPERSRPVLRAAMSGLLPDAVRLRPQKALFDDLIVDCLAGPDADVLRALLTDPAAELRAYVDLDAVVRGLLDSDSVRRRQPFRWMWQLWRLATAECWLRAQADPATLPLPAAVRASETNVVLQGWESAQPASTPPYVFPP
jgi:asparagine synthase (glutamine-hydrolysing)